MKKFFAEVFVKVLILFSTPAYAFLPPGTVTWGENCSKMPVAVLVVTEVDNGRYYSEHTLFAIGYDSIAECETKAKGYATSGVQFEKAACVPLMIP
jgi:hypothetical protein